MAGLKDYYRKPYLYDDYPDMMASQTNESTRECLADIRKFEFLKPYLPDVEDKVEDNYERIVNDFTMPTKQLVELYLLNGEDNFTLDYDRSHPPNKSHICPEIPDPWGTVMYGVAHGVTYSAPSYRPPIEVPKTKTTYTPNNNPHTDKFENPMRWYEKLAPTVQQGAKPTTSVFNSYRRKVVRVKGRVTADETQYNSAFFSISKINSDAKGVKLFQWFDDAGYIDVETPRFNQLRQIILSNQRLYNQNQKTDAYLKVDDDASGSFKIGVTDGKTTLYEDVTVQASSGLYLGLSGGGYVKLGSNFLPTTDFATSAYRCASINLWGAGVGVHYYAYTESIYQQGLTGPDIEITGPWGMCGDTDGGPPYYMNWHTHGYWYLWNNSSGETTWILSIGDNVLASDTDEWENIDDNPTEYEDVVSVCSIEPAQGNVEYNGPAPSSSEEESVTEYDLPINEQIYFSESLYAYRSPVDNQYYGNPTLITVLQDMITNTLTCQQEINGTYIWMSCNNKVYVVTNRTSIQSVSYPDTVEINGETRNLYWQYGLYEKY